MNEAERIYELLKEPFKNIKWRAGSFSEEKSTALALAYIESREVMNRLDAVVGIGNWQDRFEMQGDAIICSIGIRIDSEWIWKSDAAPKTQFEEIKGGFSDALKRAAVKWGIGRYLYYLPAQWVAAEKRGNRINLKETPNLPSWAKATTVDAPKKKSAPKVKKLKRPVEPNMLKKGLDTRAKEHIAKDSKAPAALRQQLAINLSTLFKEQGNSADQKKARYFFTNFIFGEKSCNDLAANEVHALWDWIDIKEDNGDWIPNMDAMEEANLVYRQALKDEGQLDLQEKETPL